MKTTQENVIRSMMMSLYNQCDTAYISYIDLCRENDCLGWEIKVENGTFGEDELRAHKKAAEMLGKHRALSQVATMLKNALEELFPQT